MSGEFIQAFVSNEQFQVDAFLARKPTDEIDVLHADIQGYELQMLRGAEKALGDRCIKRIFVSTHSQKLHHEVIQYLQAADYRVDVSADFERETTSFDGFVYASLPELPRLLPDVDTMGRTAICRAKPQEYLDYLGRVLDTRTPEVNL